MYFYPVFPDGPGHAMYPGQKPIVEGWAKDRRVTLLQDPVYRSTVTHNSMGYYQSPITGYYLGACPDEEDNHE